jgi:toxin HigB-1
MQEWNSQALWANYHAASGTGLFRRLVTVDINNATRYYNLVIKSFKCKETERVFKREVSRRIPGDSTRQARKKLLMLDAAAELNSLRISPSNHLEKLRAKRSGQHSIRMNDQWRICFLWRGNDAYEVEIVDCH